MLLSQHGVSISSVKTLNYQFKEIQSLQRFEFSVRVDTKNVVQLADGESFYNNL
jgi:hypothetical protein